jgi:hypothetical protein
MLKGLDDISWSDLSHAYGAATDVPGRIRAIATGDERARQEAFEGLGYSIYHQGTVYSATAYAVPYLIELVTLVANDDVRSHLYSFLALLRNGSGYYSVHAPVIESFSHKGLTPPAAEERRLLIEEEATWVKATHAAVDRAIPVCLNDLGHSSPEVRKWAADLLGQCGAKEAVGPLVALLETDSDANVLATALLALGMIGDTAALAAVHANATSGSPVVSACAAYAEIQLSGVTTRPEIVAMLARAVVDESFEDLDEILPVRIHSGLPGMAMKALGELGPTAGQAAGPILMKALDEGGGYIDCYFENLLSALLKVTFPSASAPRRADSLSPRERAILEELLAMNRAWGFFTEHIRPRQFAAFGLPGSRDELNEWLGN